jgi:hypothetical protein
MRVCAVQDAGTYECEIMLPNGNLMLSQPYVLKLRRFKPEFQSHSDDVVVRPGVPVTVEVEGMSMRLTAVMLLLLSL